MARICLVHDDFMFVEGATAALSAAGYDVTVFTDPILALDALEAGQQCQLLITRIRFGPQKPNGLSLARMIKLALRDTKVLFTTIPEHQALARDEGAVLTHPIQLPDLVAAADRLLNGAGSRTI